MKKILIIDDHPIVRFGLIVNIKKRFQHLEIFECRGDNAMAEMASRNYDVIMMEAKLSGANSLGLMKTMLQNYPGSNILIFTDCDENVYSSRFLLTGALGYVSKTASIEQIHAAIEQVAESKKMVSMLQTSTANAYLQNTSERFKRGSLTDKEFDIASLLLKGQKVSCISKLKNLKVSTVSTYKARIFFKLGISNLLQLQEALYFTTYHKALERSVDVLNGGVMKDYQFINALHA